MGKLYEQLLEADSHINEAINTASNIDDCIKELDDIVYELQDALKGLQTKEATLYEISLGNIEDGLFKLNQLYKHMTDYSFDDLNEALNSIDYERIANKAKSLNTAQGLNWEDSIKKAFIACGIKNYTSSDFDSVESLYFGYDD